MTTFLLSIDRQHSVLGRGRHEARAFSPYGALSTALIPGLAFCGQHPDPLTGCYPLGNGRRLYSPSLRRFISSDSLSPFGKGDIHAYAYCGGDPVNRHDPAGAMWEFLPTAQRALTATLHTASPVALILGPTPNGPIAVNATRLALAGSFTSLAGASLGFAGVASAPVVSAAGTAMLTTGAVARVLNTVWSNRNALWQSVKTNSRKNLRVIFKGRVEKPPRKDKLTPPNSPIKNPVLSTLSEVVEGKEAVTSSSITIHLSTTTTAGSNIRKTS